MPRPPIAILSALPAALLLAAPIGVCQAQAGSAAPVARARGGSFPPLRLATEPRVPKSAPLPPLRLASPDAPGTKLPVASEPPASDLIQVGSSPSPMPPDLMPVGPRSPRLPAEPSGRGTPSDLMPVTPSQNPSPQPGPDLPMPAPAPVDGLSLGAAGIGLSPPDDPYARAITLAEEAEQRGDRAGAAGVLEAALPQYPQDPGLPLRLAWLRFQLGQFEAARVAYGLAIQRGDRSGDAELGLGWSLARLGRCDDARPHFQAAATLGPERPGPRLGLAACPPPRPLALTPQIDHGAYFFPSHPTRYYALSTTARLSALLYERFALSAAYRITYFTTRLTTLSPWLQHDVHLSAGYGAPKVGLSLYYSMLSGGSMYPTSHHVGLTGRLSLLGDVLVSLATSVYTDFTVLRGELAWRIPLPHGFSLRPAGALQWSGSEWRPSGSLTAGYDHARFGFFVGGKYGTEFRPANLPLSVVYNGDERIPYGVWAGVTMRPGARLFFALSYALDHMTRNDSTAKFTADAQYLNLSVSREF